MNECALDIAEATPPAVSVAEFWNRIYSTSKYARIPDTRVLELALNHFGSVEGKKILEIGGGPGAASLYFGRLGADVSNLDTSQRAIDDLNSVVEVEKIHNVKGIFGSALELHKLQQVDFVYGSLILHHIEPFDEFVTQLRGVLKPGGKAFFYENSAASALLMWCRRNVIGKLWIAKRGDPEEFPLTAEEIQMLREKFGIEVQYPEMLFFGLANSYLFKRKLTTLCQTIDNILYRRRWLIRYSYRQCIQIYG